MVNSDKESGLLAWGFRISVIEGCGLKIVQGFSVTPTPLLSPFVFWWFSGGNSQRAASDDLPCAMRIPASSH
jgi:hypothetical protein